MRAHRRNVTLQDRMMLESAVNMGLPVFFAGRLLGIGPQNTDRNLR